MTNYMTYITSLVHIMPRHTCTCTTGSDTALPGLSYLQDGLRHGAGGDALELGDVALAVRGSLPVREADGLRRRQRARLHQQLLDVRCNVETSGPSCSPLAGTR